MAYEKCSIINHQGNANQNDAISLHTKEPGTTTSVGVGVGVGAGEGGEDPRSLPVTATDLAFWKTT